MAITYNKHKIGEYDYKNSDGKTYHIEIRQGNCDGVHIWIDEEGYAHLFNFIGDAQHIKNMMKDNVDAFEDTDNIKLNIWDKGAERMMKYACKMGHVVQTYYEKLY